MKTEKKATSSTRKPKSQRHDRTQFNSPGYENLLGALFPTRAQVESLLPADVKLNHEAKEKLIDDVIAFHKAEDQAARREILGYFHIAKYGWRAVTREWKDFCNLFLRSEVYIKSGQGLEPGVLQNNVQAVVDQPTGEIVGPVEGGIENVQPPEKSPLDETSDPEPTLSNRPVDPEEAYDVPLSDIDIKFAIQGRTGVNQSKVTEYKERMLAGDVFPPTMLFIVDGVKRLVDGIHRYHGAAAAGYASIRCVVVHGRWEDAVRAAVRANSSHGLPRTNADKKHVVILALTELSKQSDHAVGDTCGVSHTFVAKVRRQLATDSSSKEAEERTGRDGKTRKMPQRRKNDGGAETKTEEQPTPDEDASTGDDGSEPTTASTDTPSQEIDETAPADHSPSQTTNVDPWARIEAMLLDQIKALSSEEKEKVAAKLIEFAKGL